jgi:hypothetical protein
VLLARSRSWEARLAKQAVVVSLAKEAQTETLPGLVVDIPLDKWNRVVKHVRSDRKLIGGILLDFAKHKEHVSTAVAQDRLFFELQRVILDATTSLVEKGHLSLIAVDVGTD